MDEMQDSNEGENSELSSEKRQAQDSPRQETQACPACAESIRLAARKCRFCGELLEQCPRCHAVKAASLDCKTCPKNPPWQRSLPVRSSSVATPSPRSPEPVQVPRVRESDGGYDFRGSGLKLTALFMLCGLLLGTLLFNIVAMLLLLDVDLIDGALAELPSDVRLILGDVHELASGMEILLIITGIIILIFLIAMITAIRLYRIRNTWVFGKQLDYREGCLARYFHNLFNFFLITLSLGLALPWIIAGNHRFHYKSCIVVGQRNQNLDFAGTGSTVLGLVILTFILLPLIVGTLGIAGWLIGWLWINWYQSNVLIPDRQGKLRAVQFTGTFVDYFGLALISGLLSVLTLGLYYPWALVSRWRWIANHTTVTSGEGP